MLTVELLETTGHEKIVGANVMPTVGLVGASDRGEEVGKPVGFSEGENVVLNRVGTRVTGDEVGFAEG